MIGLSIYRSPFFFNKTLFQRTMRDMAQFTHLPPAARIERLLNFNERLRSSKRAVQLLSDWNLGLEKNLLEIPARILPYPKIIFGKDIK